MAVRPPHVLDLSESQAFESISSSSRRNPSFEVSARWAEWMKPLAEDACADQLPDLEDAVLAVLPWHADGDRKRSPPIVYVTRRAHPHQRHSQDVPLPLVEVDAEPPDELLDDPATADDPHRPGRHGSAPSATP
jgi:hypothetical protein